MTEFQPIPPVPERTSEAPAWWNAGECRVFVREVFRDYDSVTSCPETLFTYCAIRLHARSGWQMTNAMRAMLIDAVHAVWSDHVTASDRGEARSQSQSASVSATPPRSAPARSCTCEANNNTSGSFHEIGCALHRCSLCGVMHNLTKAVA